jgi:hypothetical protein
MTGEGRELVEKCRRYWHEAGLSRNAVESMAGELESHLLEASADGRGARSVIGDSLPALARVLGSGASFPRTRATELGSGGVETRPEVLIPGSWLGSRGPLRWF